MLLACVLLAQHTVPAIVSCTSLDEIDMEAVAAVATIVQLVDFSGKILIKGYGFLSQVSAAPSEMRLLLTEVANINVLLDRVRSLTDDPVTGSAQTTTDELIKLGVLNDCRLQLEQIQECLEKCKQVDGHGLANVGRKLKWAFIEKDVKNIIEQLRRLQAQINQAVNLDTAFTVSRIEETTNQISHKINVIGESTRDMLENSEKDSLLRRLFPDPIDLDEAFQSGLQLRSNTPGKWLMSSSHFQSFMTQDKNCLFWLSGKPGSGKSILCTTVIENMLNEFRSSSNGLAYFYCGYRTSNTDTTLQFLLHTTAHLLNCRPECIKQVAENMPKRDRKLMQSDYMTIIKAMIPCFETVFIAVDALDESENFEAMTQIFEELLFSRSDHEKLRIFLTSREEIDMEKAVEPLSPMRMSTSKNVNQDIHSFIISEVDQRIMQRRLKLRDGSLANDIKDSLYEAADGIFLQAKMQLDYICGLKSDRAIKDALKNLPSGLDEVYDQVLTQIMKKRGFVPEMVRTVLVWVSSSYSLMTVDEIAEAVSIRPEDTALDYENIATDPEDLVSLCGSLLKLERSPIGDGPPLVGMVHYSAEEYLFSEHIADGRLSFFKLDYHQAHLHLAKQCLQYLAFENFSHEGSMSDDWFLTDSDVSQLKNRHALLEYASRKWFDHLKDSAISEEVYRIEILPRLSWFLNPGVQGNNYRVWQSMFHANCKASLNCAYQTPFYNAIVLGMQHVVNTLLITHTSQINTLFYNGWTPLTAALTVREETIAHLLLSLGADPNLCADGEKQNGLSPLHLAAENGMEEMTALLLRLGASVHARTESQTTPFYRAARGGSIKVLTMLYKHGSDIDAVTSDGWTPLIEASCIGHETVVEKLLEWGADPAVRTLDGLDAYSISVNRVRRVIRRGLRRWVPKKGSNEGRGETVLPYRPVPEGGVEPDEEEMEVT